MVKHAADEDEPLLTAEERVDRAFVRVTAGRTFTAEQQQWLDRIRDHLDREPVHRPRGLRALPVFAREGGWGGPTRSFDGQTPRNCSEELTRRLPHELMLSKLWGFCHTLRHDGVDYGDYIEQLTYLLFLKMADEKGSISPTALQDRKAKT